MKAVLVEVAEALTCALNKHDFGLPVSAKRSYADFAEVLEDLDELHVDVVPAQHDEADLNSRDSVGYRVGLDIGIRKRFATAETDSLTGRIAIEHIDRLILLVESVHQFLCHEDQRQLTDSATWYETTIRSTYYPPDLKEHRQFTSIIRVTYDATVAL